LPKTKNTIAKNKNITRSKRNF